MNEYWGEKRIISSDFEYVSNISTLPSIICADKRSGGCKISSQYFSKMLLIPRYWTYRPIPSYLQLLPSPKDPANTLIRHHARMKTIMDLTHIFVPSVINKGSNLPTQSTNVMLSRGLIPNHSRTVVRDS